MSEKNNETELKHILTVIEALFPATTEDFPVPWCIRLGKRLGTVEPSMGPYARVHKTQILQIVKASSINHLGANVKLS